MNLAAGIGIGAIVGIAAGLWLLLTLLYIRNTLAHPSKTLIAQITALLTLPGFVGGGQWLATHSFLSQIFVGNAIGAYLFTALLFILLIDGLPCYRLIAWASDRISNG